MRKLIQENKPFFIGYLCVLLLGITLHFNFGKEACFLFVDSTHTALGDLLFPIITYFGDGLTVILIVLILLFINYRKSVILGFIYLFSSQIAQLLKRFVFNDFPRPSKYFEGKESLHFIDGVELHKMMSFPSGHTTSIFALMAFLAIITKNKKIGILYLFLACLGAFSRMYLAQHFLEDLLAGSMIGVLTALVVSTYIHKFKWYQKIPIDAALLKKKIK